jgi:DNA repair exonuclease SbcCD nuclease subunit
MALWYFEKINENDSNDAILGWQQTHDSRCLESIEYCLFDDKKKIMLKIQEDGEIYYTDDELEIGSAYLEVNQAITLTPEDRKNRRNEQYPEYVNVKQLDNKGLFERLLALHVSAKRLEADLRYSKNQAKSLCDKLKTEKDCRKE